MLKINGKKHFNAFYKRLITGNMLTKKILFCMCLLFALLVAPSAYSQGLGGAAGIVDSIAQKSGADSYKDPQQLIGTGINAALTMVGLIFLILMIYAGYLWLTARGEEEPINKAQKIIISSVIGFILVASAYAITVFVGKRFETGKADEGGALDAECQVAANSETPKKDCDICGMTPNTKDGSYDCRPSGECDGDAEEDFKNYCWADGQGDDIRCCEPSADDLDWQQKECESAEENDTPEEGCDICGKTPNTAGKGYECRDSEVEGCDVGSILDNYCWGDGQESLKIKCCKVPVQ